MGRAILFSFLIIMAACASQVHAQQGIDTAGCYRLINYRYDKFTEEKKIWTNKGFAVENAAGEADYPMAASVYKIRFYNVLSGIKLEQFDPSIIISDELLKQPVSEKDVTVYFIFDDDTKFTVRSGIINNGYESRLALPLEGLLLASYKAKKLKALRLTGVRGTSIDFYPSSAQSEQLVNELACMFSYKQ